MVEQSSGRVSQEEVRSLEEPVIYVIGPGNGEDESAAEH